MIGFPPVLVGAAQRTVTDFALTFLLMVSLVGALANRLGGGAYSSRFGVSAASAPAITPVVARPTTSSATLDGETNGLSCSSRAMTPDTCGVAIDVPLRSVVPVFELLESDRIPTPGA